MNIIGYHLLHQWDSRIVSPVYFFFFNDTATTEIYTLSLHDALPICRRRRDHRRGDRARCGAAWLSHGRGGERSEEHTSELQSQSNLVCRLLLEKKKRRLDGRALWLWHWNKANALLLIVCDPFFQSSV